MLNFFEDFRTKINFNVVGPRLITTGGDDKRPGLCVGAYEGWMISCFLNEVLTTYYSNFSLWDQSDLTKINLFANFETIPSDRGPVIVGTPADRDLTVSKKGGVPVDKQINWLDWLVAIMNSWFSANKASRQSSRHGPAGLGLGRRFNSCARGLARETFFFNGQ